MIMISQVNCVPQAKWWGASGTSSVHARLAWALQGWENAPCRQEFLVPRFGWSKHVKTLAMCDNSAWITRPNPRSTFRINAIYFSVMIETPLNSWLWHLAEHHRNIAIHSWKTFFHTDCDPFGPFDPTHSQVAPPPAIRRQVRAEKRLRESAEERSARLLREVPGSPAINRSTRHVYFLGLLKILSDYQIIIIFGLFRSCPLHRIYIVFRLFRSSRCSYGLNIQVWWWTVECAEIYMGLPGTSAKFSQKR